MIASGLINAATNANAENGLNWGEAFLSGAASAGIGLASGGLGFIWAGVITSSTNTIFNQIFSDTGFKGLFNGYFATNLLLSGGFGALGANYAGAGIARFGGSKFAQLAAAVSTSIYSSAQSAYLGAGLDRAKKIQDEYDKTPSYNCDEFGTSCYGY